MTASDLTSGRGSQATELVVALERLVPELSAAEQLEVHNAMVSLWKTLLQHLLSTQAGPAVAPSKQADAVLTLEEAAACLRRSRSWLYHRWRSLRLGYRDGGRVRFRQHDLDRYVNAQRRGL